MMSGLAGVVGLAGATGFCAGGGEAARLPDGEGRDGENGRSAWRFTDERGLGSQLVGRCTVRRRGERRHVLPIGAH